MSRHTPGPWAVCEVQPNDYWHAGSTIGASDPKDGRRVCDVFTGGARGDDIQEMHAANARLIAAAPDLLDVLLAIQADQSWRTNDNSLWPRINEVVRRATQPLPPPNEETK